MSFDWVGLDVVAGELSRIADALEEANEINREIMENH